MVEIDIKLLKLSEIKTNPENPRRITKEQMDRLTKSIEEFPDMMTLREIIVDENMMILGGNMRYLALMKTGKEYCTAKIVTGLTQEQKREFIIKDNAAFGDWDFDALANGWSDLPLVEWGIRMYSFSDDVNAEYTGMPAHNEDDLAPVKSLTVNFATLNDMELFAELVNQKITEKTKSIWYPEAEIMHMDKIYKDES